MKSRHFIILKMGFCFCVLLLTSAKIFAQQNKPSRIVNELGNPISEAIVSNKATDKMVITNSKGEFNNKANAGDTLVISKLGYQMQQVIVTANALEIVLKAQSPFQHTIVLPFNTVINEAHYTGAVSVISGDMMEQYHTPNATNALSGRVSGLITRAVSDEPGADAASFYVRGRSSYNNDAPNLYVDNVPISFAQLDPLEIDQLVVLKDGIANGVYGMDGANKSIFVTTKRGKAYQNQINFYSSLGFQKPTALPKFLGAQRYMELYNEAAVNDGLPAKYTQGQIDSYNQGSDPINNPDADWYGTLFKNQSVMQKYNLSVSGGNNVVRYFILGGVTTQQGLFNFTDLNFDKYGYKTNSKFNRYNLRSNFDVSINKTLSAFVDLSARIEERTSPGTTAGSSDIINRMAIYPPNLFPVVFPDGAIGGNAQYNGSPYGLLTSMGYFTGVNRTTFGNVGLKQELSSLVPGLSASVAYSFYNSFINNEGFYSGTPTFATYSYVNGVKQVNGVDKLPVYTTAPGTQNRIGTFWAKADYFGSFSADHKLGVSIGYNQSKNTPAGDDFPYASVNLFAKANYQFKGRYLIDAALSRSTTEIFPEHKRYGLFPSVGAGWIISNESFMENTKLLNFLKLRGSYAVLGNGNIGGLLNNSPRSRYLYVDLFNNNGTVYNFGQTPTAANGYAEGALANNNVTWEKQQMVNVGLDAALLKNTLGFSVDVYSEKRSQILAIPNISALVGQTLRPLNLGKVDNHGLDVTIWYQNDQHEFKYRIGGNISLNRNKIIYNAEAIKAYPYLYTTGQPVGEIFGLRALGFFKDQADIDNSPIQTFQTGLQPGSIKYQDRNGDNRIDENDFEPIAKSSTPETYFGFDLGFSYKSFDFTVNLQGASGYSVNLRSNATFGFTNNASPSALMEDRWTPATAATAKYPSLSFKSANNYQPSTFWIKDVNFIRLKQAELGYSFYGGLLQRIKVKKLRLFASGLNLATWDNLAIDYVDPESAQAGISQYPRMKNWVFGLNVQF